MRRIGLSPINLNDIPNTIKEFLNRLISITFPHQGYTSNVAIIESDRGMFALKRTRGERFHSWLKKEVSILNSLRTTDLPVPKVWEFVEENHECWALLDYIEGETIRQVLFTEKSQEKRREIIFRFGEILSKIHSTPCPEELKTNEPWLDRMLKKAENNLTHYEVDGSRKLLERLKENKPKEFTQTFIHGDFTIDNVLVSNGVITGIIDWAGGAYGDPRYDVSLAIRPKPNAFETERDKLIFFEGYGQKIIDEEEYNYFANGLYEFF